MGMNVDMDMNVVWIALGGLLAVIIIAANVLSRGPKKKAKPVAEEVDGAAVPPLLTPPELACFNVLHEVAGAEYHVMAKVSLSDVAIVKRGVDKEVLEKVSRQGRRHIDFVLCDREHLGVVCAIELGDAKSSGSRKEPTVGEILQQVGIQAFRLPVKTSYSIVEIREILTPYLKQQPPSPDEMVATISMTAFRGCKKCQSRMVLKRARSGKYKGMLFWVCSRFPECRTVDVFTK